MKTLGWTIVFSGLLLQYLISSHALPTGRGLWWGLPVAVFGMVAGLVLNWLGYIVLFRGGLGARTAELDAEAAERDRERAASEFP